MHRRQSTQQQPLRQVQIKLVLLGDSATGKSSLVHRYVRNQFNADREPTIGAAFLTKKCRVPEHPDRILKFEIWDTAGQERFNSLAPMYYRNAHAAIVVYDSMQPKTLERAKAWIAELQQHASPDIVIALAGNKCDLCPTATTVFDSEPKQAAQEVGNEIGSESNNLSKRASSISIKTTSTLSPPTVMEPPVDQRTALTLLEQQYNDLRVLAERYAKDNNLLFYETSAKSGVNVGEMFIDIGRNLPWDLLSARESPYPSQPGTPLSENPASGTDNQESQASSPIFRRLLLFGISSPSVRLSRTLDNNGSVSQGSDNRQDSMGNRCAC